MHEDDLDRAGEAFARLAPAFVTLSATFAEVAPRIEAFGRVAARVYDEHRAACVDPTCRLCTLEE